MSKLRIWPENDFWDIRRGINPPTFDWNNTWIKTDANEEENSWKLLLAVPKTFTAILQWEHQQLDVKFDTEKTFLSYFM